MSRKITSIMQRLGALTLALAMAFTLLLSGMTVKAAPTIGYDDDGTEITTGSLTIHKYVGNELEEMGEYPTQAEMEAAVEQALGDGQLTPLSDVVFSYLRVGEVAQGTDDDGNITIGYSISSELMTQFGGASSYLETAFTEEGTTYYTPKSLDEALSQMSQNAMETFMQTNGGTEMDATDGSGETTASGLALGLYLVVETGYPANVTRTTDPFFVSIPMTDGTEDDGFNWIYDVDAYPKNGTGTIDIDKSVVEDGDESKNIDGEIGDAKTFVIRADVPGAIGNMQKYTITDTLSDGLTFTGEAPTVRGITAAGAAETLTDGTHYNFTGSSASQDLVFAFIPSAMGSGSVANYVQVEITYTAFLNADAVVGTPGNPNGVRLDYSTTTDVDSGDTTERPSTLPAVYTYAIDLLKYGDGNTENPLGGVEFELHDSTYDASNPSASKIAVSQSGDQTYYYVMGATSGGTDTPITTDDNGKIDLRGLEAGTYYLVETKTTGDYNLLAEAIEIVITSNEGSYTQSADGTFAPYETGESYYADATRTTPIITPENANDGDYINFGTSTVYRSNGTQVDMYSPDALTWSATVGGENATMGTDGQITVNVNNSTGFQLPATGGSGTILFTVIGGILIIGAVALLYKASRKKNGTDAGAAE